MTEIEQTLYNPEAEQSLLGAVIINSHIYNTIDIQPDEFFIQRNGAIWKAIGSLFLKDISIDFETICDELTRMNWLDQIGGASYLATLISNTSSSLHAESYALIIRDYYHRRQLIQTANKIASMVYDKDCILEDELINIIDEISRNVARSDGAAHWKTYLDELYEDIIERMKNPKKIWGIPTGFGRFDKITGGLQQSEMLLFSGKPGVGKSIWVMQAAEQMAKNAPGAIYSVEMPGIQTLRRTLSAKSGVEVHKMKSGEILDTDLNNITNAFEVLNSLPVYLSDASDWSTSSLRADLQRLKIRHGIKWFVFDYMMLANDGKGLGETERTTMLSRNFKLICRQLNLAGIIIHSMRKAGIENTNPDQQDLRGSAQSVYDADLICFLNEFIPMEPKDNYVDNKENLRTLTFGKGRELEQPKKYIHMVKRPCFPMFGDLVEIEQ
jgi:replicative DNA helicase